MACVKVEGVNVIVAPCYRAFYFKYLAGFLYPDLFFEGAWYWLLLIFFVGGLSHNLFRFNFWHDAEEFIHLKFRPTVHSQFLIGPTTLG